MNNSIKHPSALAAHVDAVNRANFEANRLTPILSNVFAPFVGKKVLKKEGGLLETVKKAVPAFPSTVHLQVFRDTSEYQLRFSVKTCEMYGEHSCIYAESYVWVGNLAHGVLEKLTDSPVHRTDYTVEGVFNARKLAEETRAAAQKAEAACQPFGLYDR